MTVPGELDKVPIKVVPIYFEPVVEFEPLEPETVVEPEQKDAPRRSTRIVGALSLLGAVVAAVLTGVGVAVASGGAYDAGTVIAWVAIVLSAVAVLGGLVAAVARWGRPWGIAAVIVGVAANPWVLATVLGALAG
ncbi:hypothetical protein [Antiquaquibacter soli]|uniref:Uncharacterized protein n=1 Tax=Antiquaquibacter soli TaxID=3064523 RepID=A0ABT9BM60_9MICO|nr:hypothetical protein [Protaetiibacter sp. WY-16]MDO7880871.1 hypothetical protein [Protaetiibacter sp. WY-16]